LCILYSYFFSGDFILIFADFFVAQEVTEILACLATATMEYVVEVGTELFEDLKKIYKREQYSLPLAVISLRIRNKKNIFLTVIPS